MPRGFQIGRLFGTDIYATAGFLLLLAVYFFLGRASVPGAAVWCIAVVISLLVHEFGHVFAVRWFARSESTVLLWMMGGLCIHPPVYHRGKQFGISVMGPVFGFALAGLTWLAHHFWAPGHPLMRLFVVQMLWINIIWNALNLLPIWPLDGGQALRAALAAAFGGPRAAAVVRRVSIATAGLGAYLAFQAGFTFAVALAFLLLIENLQGAGPTRD